MVWKLFPKNSLKARITLASLAIFASGIWLLSFSVNHILFEDMKRLLGEQQFSTASIIAAKVNQQFDNRFKALEKVAALSVPAMRDGRPKTIQHFVEQQSLLHYLFNAGIVVFDTEGSVIAEFPVSAGRRGVNYMDRDYVVAALKEGKSTVGKPILGRKLQAPIFGAAVPIRDAHGKVIGALGGVTNLGLPGFLDELTDASYGKNGGYHLVAPESRLVVAASDKARVMEQLPAPGINPALDRFIGGHEGSLVFTDTQGVEVLASAKKIPLAGWYLAVSMPTADIFDARYTQLRILLVTLLLTLLTGSLTYRMLHRQFAPITSAVHLLTAQSENEEPPQSLPIVYDDEIGHLIGRFNHLLGKLRLRKAALQASEMRFRQLLEDIPSVAIQGYGPDGTTHYWNRASELLYGYSAEEAIGRNVLDLIIPPEMHDEVREDIRRMFASGQPIPAGPLSLIRKDGSRVDVFSSHACVCSPGKAPEMFCVDIDLSERKAAEAALQEALLKAEAATRAKSEFLAHMSHEIRTPMNAIVGAARLIEYESLTPRQLGYTKILRSASQSLQALVDDILDLSKIEAGHLELKSEIFDLAGIVDSLAGCAAFLAQGKKIKIRFNLAPDLPLRLIGDSHHLEQVLVNLFSNAVKFTDQGEITLGVQKVSADTENVVLHFALSDTGIGIASDKLETIFAPFQQAESTVTRRHDGTGLGLAICRRIVQRMGGKIWVESVPGQGSCFMFTAVFGLADASATTDVQGTWRNAGASLPSSITALAGRRVLMVEDNPFNREVLEGMLQHLGIEVDTAVDGYDGIECFEVGSPYAAVLMDLHLPGLDGFDCARGIRTLPEGRQVPIIAITANVLSTTEAACRAAGMNGYLVKPVEPETLYRTLAHWILGATPAAPPPPPTPLATPAERAPADRLPDELPGLDLDKASAWSHGSAHTLTDLLDRMLAHSGDDPAKLAQHIAAGELEAAAQITHDLMAAAATVGASALVAAARRLNREIRAATPASAQAGEAIGDIDMAFAQLHAAHTILRAQLA